VLSAAVSTIPEWSVLQQAERERCGGPTATRPIAPVEFGAFFVAVSAP